jgi:hypothetical protein
MGWLLALASGNAEIHVGAMIKTGIKLDISIKRAFISITSLRVNTALAIPNIQYPN